MLKTHQVCKTTQHARPFPKAPRPAKTNRLGVPQLGPSNFWSTALVINDHYCQYRSTRATKLAMSPNVSTGILRL